MKQTLTRHARSSKCRQKTVTIALAALGAASMAYSAALKLADPWKILDFPLIWGFFGLVFWLFAFRRKGLFRFLGKTLFRRGLPRAFGISSLSLFAAISLAFLGLILVPIDPSGTINQSGTVDPAAFATENRDADGAFPEYCLLLGGGIRRDGSPSTILESRIAETARVWKTNPGLIIVVTGGKLDELPCTEAESMARALADRYRVPRERILLEGEARDTIGNFALSRELVDRDASARDPGRDLRSNPPRVAVVTSGFHMNRSLFLARRSGMSVGWAFRARTPALQAPNAVLREIGSYWKLSARMALRAVREGIGSTP